MPKEFNAAPYYDDYDESKNYHKIIFNPNATLQSRELTQLQSVIQNQVERLSNFTFENGAMVIPGNISYIGNSICVKIDKLYNGLSVANYIGTMTDKIVVGSDTNVRAKIYHSGVDLDSAYVFISYISGGIDSFGTHHAEFVQGETLTLLDKSNSINVSNEEEFYSYGSLATVNAGVYYFNGYFVENQKQTITIDRYSTEPSCQIGFNVEIQSVSSIDDESLTDNSSGFNNPVAIGADRMKIDLVLSKHDYFSTLTNIKFISLLRVKDGTIQSIVNKTQLSRMGDLLAKRTYEESGDYLVKPFKYELFDYRDNRRGEWVGKTAYLAGDICQIEANGNVLTLMALSDGISSSVKPKESIGIIKDGSLRWVVTSKPYYNKGYASPSNTDTLEQHMENADLGVLKISGGQAYLRGKDVDLRSGFKTVVFTKARDSKKMDPFYVESPVGQYLLVTKVIGLPVITTVDETNYALKTHNILDQGGGVIGSCKVRNFEFHASSKYIFDNNTFSVYKIHVFDILFLNGKSLGNDAAYIGSKDGTFLAMITGDLLQLPGFINRSTNIGNDNIFAGTGNVLNNHLKVRDKIYVKENV